MDIKIHSEQIEIQDMFMSCNVPFVESEGLGIYGAQMTDRSTGKISYLSSEEAIEVNNSNAREASEIDNSISTTEMPARLRLINILKNRDTTLENRLSRSQSLGNLTIIKKNKPREVSKKNNNCERSQSQPTVPIAATENSKPIKKTVSTKESSAQTLDMLNILPAIVEEYKPKLIELMMSTHEPSSVKALIVKKPKPKKTFESVGSQSEESYIVIMKEQQKSKLLKIPLCIWQCIKKSVQFIISIDRNRIRIVFQIIAISVPILGAIASNFSRLTTYVNAIKKYFNPEIEPEILAHEPLDGFWKYF